MYYRGKKTSEISFPLGGIGSGCIGLAGNGALIDWEIMNSPSKCSANGFSHFAVKAESDGKVLDVRVLNSDLQPPFTGKITRKEPGCNGYGFGPDSTSMAGLPHFEGSTFCGEFPISKIKFLDKKFPGSIEMMAFNPFIPLNDQDSSIPGAFFEFEVENTTNMDITYTFGLSASNMPVNEKRENKYGTKNGIHFIELATKQLETDNYHYGSICIATDAQDISYQEYWYRGGWCDNLDMYYRDFIQPGKLKNRAYETEQTSSTDTSTLAAHLLVLPGEKKKVRFSITWDFANVLNWGTGWKNYYASLFESAVDSSLYALNNWERLYQETEQFKNALFSSTLPKEVIDAISANLSVLKSPTVFRLTDGSFYGFEGCLDCAGSCEGSCTHVWNYAYALPFLFPKLERSMRNLDYKYNQREDGRMCFRLQLPLGKDRWNYHACVDGQFGGVIKVYREWKICGDGEWLKSVWGAVKKSIEYAWAPTNEDKWDPNQDGVIQGRQHHTLDMELFGASSWLNGFYLTALKAAAEMASYLDEPETAKKYMSIFEKGKRWTDENLFNGEYYYQKVDLKDKDMLGKFVTGEDNPDHAVYPLYWNDEVKEIKYQIGDGCEIDQVLAQWHANLCGLGEIFDKEKTKKALNSIYKYNFKPVMRDVANTWRIFCLNEESGMIMCSWPDGQYKPAIPLTYSSETMTGFEYQVAVHMIQEGMIEEGLTVVKAIRGRYDGEKRNPWSEIECGSNYARSMASYSLLNAFSGFEYDMVHGMIGFNPILSNNKFKCFWSLDSGWGIFTVKPDKIEIKVLSGEINIKILKLPFIKHKEINSITINNKALEYTNKEGILYFDNDVKFSQECCLKIICFN